MAIMFTKRYMHGIAWLWFFTFFNPNQLGLQLTSQGNRQSGLPQFVWEIFANLQRKNEESNECAIKKKMTRMVRVQKSCLVQAFIPVVVEKKLVMCKGWANPQGSRVRVRVRILWPSTNPYPCEGSGGFQRLLFLKYQSTLECVYLLNLSLNIV